MTSLRIEAVLTWAYVLGFGGSTLPVAVFLRRQGRLPSFLGRFEMYGGPWSDRFAQGTFVWLLLAFLVVTLLAAWAAWLVWNASKAGAIFTLALLPIEAVFWFGFALPIPVVIGVARVVLLIVGWRSLA
jgi:hypothetical protein